MQLDEMVQCLIALGASVGADCKACVQTCTVLARQCGADEQAIETAMAVAGRVKRCAGQMQKPVEGSARESSATGNGSATCCGSAEIK